MIFFCSSSYCLKMKRFCCKAEQKGLKRMGIACPDCIGVSWMVLTLLQLDTLSMWRELSCMVRHTPSLGMADLEQGGLKSHPNILTRHLYLSHNAKFAMSWSVLCLCCVAAPDEWISMPCIQNLSQVCPSANPRGSQEEILPSWHWKPVLSPVVQKCQLWALLLSTF